MAPTVTGKSNRRPFLPSFSQTFPEAKSLCRRHELHDGVVQALVQDLLPAQRSHGRERVLQLLPLRFRNQFPGFHHIVP